MNSDRAAALATPSSAAAVLGVSDASPRPAPLAPLLLFVWINSLAGGALGIGVPFIAKHGYAFTDAQNFGLMTLMGAMYVAGALGAGPLVRRLTAPALEGEAGAPASGPEIRGGRDRARARPRSARAVLIAIMLCMAALCAASFFIGRQWSVWMLGAVYQPLAGVLWPIVESFLSGGRRAAGLRRAIGVFNYVWASAIFVAFWVLSPLLEHHAPMAFAGAAALHVLCAALALALPRSPARHLDEAHEPHPDVYPRLLRCFRWLLALSYVLMYALSPALVARAPALSIDADWMTRIVSVWMAVRVAMFFLLQRWHGWHGRRRTPVWTGAAMIAGFALSLLAPTVPLLVAGLALFGVGAGGVYCAALYYAMEVGSAEVEAGGKHEATIGAGMTLGPLAGLAVFSLVGARAIPEPQAAPALVAIIGVLCVFGVAAAANAVRRR